MVLRFGMEKKLNQIISVGADKFKPSMKNELWSKFLVKKEQLSRFEPNFKVWNEIFTLAFPQTRARKPKLINPDFFNFGHNFHPKSYALHGLTLGPKKAIFFGKSLVWSMVMTSSFNYTPSFWIWSQLLFYWSILCLRDVLLR